ncbi:S49 family peptidase [Massilia sp. BJB1822]|uniref:S49 family peptidase n=1 Tax=Massilia sp. BJB1822 TaxID=2744470 RepID=UPI00159409F3|nr:S49 family peptidase [Massilia sp. BJB1822]NVD97715.1 S49 family peptidase [Massilia sp. BJB1822]
MDENETKTNEVPSTESIFLQLIQEMREQRQSFREEQQLLTKERRSARRWNIGLRLVMIAVPLAFGGFFLWQAAGITLGPFRDVVGIVEIKGEMAEGKLASAEKVIPALEKAFENPRVKHVVLAIDSPGGAPVEAERIGNAIAIFKKTHPKPVTAIIGSLGASAAYMTAMRADRIVAGRYSLVGSIGAIIAPWQLDKAIAQLQISQRVYASGKLKAFLNPFTPVSDEADAKAHELVDGIGRAFIRELEQRRGARLKKDVDYGTGEVWSGPEAMKLGLVDELGTVESFSRGRPGMSEYSFGPRESGFGYVRSYFSELVLGTSSFWLGKRDLRLW